MHDRGGKHRKTEKQIQLAVRVGQESGTRYIASLTWWTHGYLPAHYFIVRHMRTSENIPPSTSQKYSETE